MKSFSLDPLIARIPVVRTLAVCTRESKRDARVELTWQIGFALLSVFVVGLIVLLTQPPQEFFSRIYPLISRGELMVYAASLCGATLYVLRHHIKAPIPDVLIGRITPVGNLTVWTGILMLVAVCSYIVRKMSDLHHISMNDNLLYILSWAVLAASLVISYVVFSLKHSLTSGYSTASREQTQDFSSQWLNEVRDGN